VSGELGITEWDDDAPDLSAEELALVQHFGMDAPDDVEGMRFGFRLVAGVALSVVVVVGLIVWAAFS